MLAEAGLYVVQCPHKRTCSWCHPRLIFLGYDWYNNCGMLRRSRCVQIFLMSEKRVNNSSLFESTVTDIKEPREHHG